MGGVFVRGRGVGDGGGGGGGRLVCSCVLGWGRATRSITSISGRPIADMTELRCVLTRGGVRQSCTTVLSARTSHHHPRKAKVGVF